MSLNLSVQSLINGAKESAGLEDFGNDSFMEGLRILVDSFNNEARLNDIGIQSIPEIITRYLVNRLNVQDWISRHPEILDEKVAQPIIITGLPRTGTTFLQILLSVDPANRPLHHWEARQPCPPPQLVHSATDSRIQSAHEEFQLIEALKPELQAIHHLDAGGFTECMRLVAHEFKSTEFNAFIEAPSYAQWLLNCDMTSAYAYHELLLKLLQWRLPNERWVLKSPFHLISLGALLGQYPDAQIIFTHRDPLKAITSLSSLYSAWNSLFSDEIENHKIANWCARYWATIIKKAMKERSRHNSEIFYDLQYQDLITDPLGSVKRIYKFFGRKVGIGHERCMQAWIRDNPQSKRGRHRYSIQKFGIIPEEERKRFAEYQEQFGMPIES